MQALKELIFNNIDVVVVLIIIYILGFVFKLTKDIFKEKKK